MRSKKFYKRFIIYLLVILGSGILVPYLIGLAFEDKFHILAIRELEKSLNSDIQIEDTRISFFKSWPDVEVDLRFLKIFPNDGNARIEIIEVGNAAVTVDFYSFFSDNYVVEGIHLKSPTIHIFRSPGGEWNYSSLGQKRLPEGKTQGETTLSLRSFRISNGHLLIQDPASGLDISMESLNLDLSGDFNSSSSAFEAKFDAGLKKWKDGGITYLKDKQISGTLGVDALLGENKHYSITSGKVQIASLHLDLGGTIQQSDDLYKIDIDYVTNQNSFESISEMLPKGMLDPGEAYEYSGELTLKGWLKGFAGKGRRPGIFAEFDVRDGAISHEKLPDPMQKVRLTGAYLSNPDMPSLSYFEIKDASGSFHEKPLHGSFSYKNFSDPRFNLDLDGELSASELESLIPGFPDSLKVHGDLDIELHVQGKVSDLKTRRYAKVQTGGKIILKDCSIASPAFAHPLIGLNGTLIPETSGIKVIELAGTAGKSDFLLNGTISGIPDRIFDSTATITSRLRLESKLFNPNEIFVVGNSKNSGDRIAFNLPENLDIILQANARTFHYMNLRANDIHTKITLRNDKLSVNFAHFNIFGGDIRIRGKVEVNSDVEATAGFWISWTGVDINKVLRTFSEWSDLALVQDHLSGRSDGSMQFYGTIDPAFKLDKNTLDASGQVSIFKGKLTDFKPLEHLSGFIKLKKLRNIEFSDINTKFSISEGVFHLSRCHLVAADYHIEVEGNHGFDKTLDYRLLIDLPRLIARKSASKQVQEWIETEEGPELRVSIPVWVTGTSGDPKFKLDGERVKKAVKKGLQNEKEELKESFDEEVTEFFGEQDTATIEDWIEVEDDEKGMVNFFKNFKPFKKKNKKKDK